MHRRARAVPRPTIQSHNLGVHAWPMQPLYWSPASACWRCVRRALGHSECFSPCCWQQLPLLGAGDLLLRSLPRALIGSGLSGEEEETHTGTHTAHS
jgi:hypothetical protein